MMAETRVALERALKKLRRESLLHELVSALEREIDGPKGNAAIVAQAAKAWDVRGNVIED